MDQCSPASHCVWDGTVYTGAPHKSKACDLPPQPPYNAPPARYPARCGPPQLPPDDYGPDAVKYGNVYTAHMEEMWVQPNTLIFGLYNHQGVNQWFYHSGGEPDNWKEVPPWWRTDLQPSFPRGHWGIPPGWPLPKTMIFGRGEGW